MCARMVGLMLWGFGCCAPVSGQMLRAAEGGSVGGPARPAGEVVYSNPYDGTSTFGNAAQIFEEALSGYDIWLGDDFETSDGYGDLELCSVGFCGNGCVDPFLVQDFFAQIWDGSPCDPGSSIRCESTGFTFNGIDTWCAQLEEGCCLQAADYYFILATRNDFGTNGQTYFFQQTKGGEANDGFQWNPGGAFGFPGGCQTITEADGVTASSPNCVITGDSTACTGPCVFELADCNGDFDLNVLDFICFQGAFQRGELGADCNGDGNYDILDFVCFQGVFFECLR